ncbi:hypothetical protein GCM10009527_042310 [Actinomadura nitritigenes]
MAAGADGQDGRRDLAASMSEGRCRAGALALARVRTESFVMFTPGRLLELPEQMKPKTRRSRGEQNPPWSQLTSGDEGS